jgi:cytochrome c oxidase subunit 2
MALNKQILGIVILLVATGLIGCNPDVPATSKERGEVLYAACISCHMDDGSGMANIGAPAIAGMSQWYVEAQLRKFKAGIRGYHHDDTEGLRMRPMALFLRHEADIAAVASYVASMAPVAATPTLEGGDPAAGKMYYATCATCHGDNAMGNIDQSAPALVGLNDWYMLNQLNKFKHGVRGANPKDTTGALMAPMAMTLADEQAMKSVIAYIQTLKN